MSLLYFPDVLLRDVTPRFQKWLNAMDPKVDADLWVQHELPPVDVAHGLVCVHAQPDVRTAFRPFSFPFLSLAQVVC